jgi:hypothetical protein
MTHHKGQSLRDLTPLRRVKGCHPDRSEAEWRDLLFVAVAESAFPHRFKSAITRGRSLLAAHCIALRTESRSLHSD